MTAKTPTPTPRTDAALARESKDSRAVELCCAQLEDELIQSRAQVAELTRNLADSDAMREQAWMDKGITALQGQLGEAERKLADALLVSRTDFTDIQDRANEIRCLLLNGSMNGLSKNTLERFALKADILMDRINALPDTARGQRE